MAKKTPEEIKAEKEAKLRAKEEAKRAKAEAAAKKKRDKEYKKLLANEAKKRAKEIKSNTAGKSYDGYVDSLTVGFDSLYLNSKAKEMGVDARKLSFLTSAAKLGDSLNDVLKSDAFKASGLDKDTCASLLNAAKVDVEHQAEMLGEVDKLINKNNLIANKLKPKDLFKKAAAKKVNLPKADKAKKQQVEKLRKQLAAKKAVQKKNFLTMAGGGHRTAAYYMSKPGLTQEEKNQIAREAHTTEGRIKHARAMMDDIMKLDINEFANMTPEEYVKNYERNEYIRTIAFDKTWSTLPGVSEALFSNKAERDAFDKYMVSLQDHVNYAKSKLDLTTNELSNEIDFDKMDMASIGDFMGLDSHMAVIGGELMTQRQVELEKDNIAKVLTDGKENIKKARVDAIKDACLSRPGISDIEKNVYNSLTGPDELASAALGYIKASYISGDIKEAQKPEQAAFNKKLAGISSVILNQAREGNVPVTPADKAMLDSITRGGGIKEAREAAFKAAAAEFKKNPTADNLKMLLEANKGQIANMTENPKFDYAANQVASAITNKAVGDVLDANYQAASFALGMTGINETAANILKTSGSLKEAQNRLNSEAIKWGSKKDKEIFEKNVNTLYEAAQSDVKERSERIRGIDTMMDNAKNMNTDPQKIAEVGAKYGIKVRTTGEQEKYAQLSNTLKEKYKNMSITATTLDTHDKMERHYTPAMSMSGVSERDKSIIKDACCNDPAKKAAAYDVFLDVFDKMDPDLFKTDRSFEEMVDHFDDIQPATQLVWDSENLFKEMDAAIAKGTYKPDMQQYNSTKEFAKSLLSRAGKINQMYSMGMTGAASVLDVENMTTEQAQKLMTDPSNMDAMSLSQCKFAYDMSPDSNMKLAHECKEYMTSVRTETREEYLKNSQEKLVEDMRKDYVKLRKAGNNETMKENIAKDLVEKASKLTYLDWIDKNSDNLTSKQMDDLLSPTKVSKSVETLKPKIAEGMNEIRIDDFQKALSSSTPSKASKLITDTVTKVAQRQKAAEALEKEHQKELNANEKKNQAPGMVA